MVDEKYRAFLIEQLRTHEIHHSGRHFYAHLAGTHDLLQAWGNSESVCLAGLFHSIYGTWHFQHKAFPIERRHVIRDLIGEEAEFLTYVFCVAERPKEFLASYSGPDILITDHVKKDVINLTRAELNALLEIEAANLIEQGGNVHATLHRLAETGISEAAKQGIAKHLAAHALKRPPVLVGGHADG